MTETTAGKGKPATKTPAEKKAETAKQKKAAEAKKKTAEAKAVAVVEEQAVSLPMVGGGAAGRGFDEFEDDDLIIAYAKLMQPLSPEVQEDEGQFEEVSQGDLLNSLTGANYGTKLTFIPLLFKKRRIKWIPRDDGGGMECGSGNARIPDTGEMLSASCSMCPHSKWTRGPEIDKQGNEVAGTMVNRPPACDLLYVFPSMVITEGTEDADRLVAITFSRTSFNAGKRLVNIARMSGGDIFRKPYMISTRKEKNDKGIFFVIDVNPAGNLSEDQYKGAEGLFEMLHSIQYKFHDESEEVSEGPSNGDFDEVDDGDVF